MGWRTHQWAVALRNTGRALGVTRLVADLLADKDYEARYDARFSDLLRADDCVWDVGANIGYYTAQFAARVGPSGFVYAFEPSPVNFARLQSACAALPQVHPLNCALGHQAGVLPFQQGSDDLGATSRIVANDDAGHILVQVSTGDTLIAEGKVRAPNAIKIDVEGFELEVVQGLQQRLNDPTLRVIGIEVHFRLLSERGLNAAPKALEDMLRSAGFGIKWPDNSHMIGVRAGA